MRKYEVESYMNMYFKKNIKVLEDALEIPLQANKVKLELYYNNQAKVDFYTQTVDGREVFVESQVTYANEQHCDFVKRLIDIVPGGSIIVWISGCFTKRYRQEIREAIKDKNITFYFLQLSIEAYVEIKELKKVHVMRVLKSINRLDLVKDIFFMDIDIINPLEPQRLHPIKLKEQQAMKNLLKKLKDIELPVFQKERNSLSFGFGKSNVMLVNMNNRYGYSVIKLNFAKDNVATFKHLRSKQSQLQNQIHKNLFFDTEKMTMQIELDNKDVPIQDRPDEIKGVIEKIIEQMITDLFYFSTPQYQLYAEQYEVDSAF